MSEQNTLKLSAMQLKHTAIIHLGDELSDKLLTELKDLVLSHIYKHHNKFVVLVLSSLKFMDSLEYNELIKVAKMAEILGAKTVLVGLDPGIIMHLINENINTEVITSYHVFDDALAAIGIVVRSEESAQSVIPEVAQSNLQDNALEFQADRLGLVDGLNSRDSG